MGEPDMGELNMEGQEPNPALAELADTYGQCLALGRDYAARTITAEPVREVDLEALERFLSARADLLGLAEARLNDLAGTAADTELRRGVLAILEEMAEMETRLSAFLHDRLDQMRRTIGRMKKAQPVFKRYGYLGGPMAPSRVTRHE